MRLIERSLRPPMLIDCRDTLVPMLAAANPWATLGDYPPFVADVDKVVLAGLPKDKYELRLDVLPHVWHGNPLTARALLLMLNPGFSEQDLRDQAAPVLRDAVRLALSLQPTARFRPLTPELGTTSAALWWRQRLAPLVAALGPVGEETARAHLSDIEYFPYHSVSWRSPPHLPSQEFGFDLVQRAIDRGAVIVVMRGWERWRAAVPGLNGYPLGYRNNNPRQAAVSRRNLGDEPFDALVSALTAS